MFKDYNDLVLFVREVNPDIKNEVAKLTDYRFYPGDTRKTISKYDSYRYENGQISIRKEDNNSSLDFYVNLKGGNRQTRGENKDYFLTIKNYNLNRIQNLLVGVRVENLVEVKEKDANNIYKYSTDVVRTSNGVKIENVTTIASMLNPQSSVTSTTKMNLSMVEFYALLQSLNLIDLVTPFQV